MHCFCPYDATSVWVCLLTFFFWGGGGGRGALLCHVKNQLASPVSNAELGLPAAQLWVRGINSSYHVLHGSVPRRAAWTCASEIVDLHRPKERSIDGSSLTSKGGSAVRLAEALASSGLAQLILLFFCTVGSSRWCWLFGLCSPSGFSLDLLLSTWNHTGMSSKALESSVFSMPMTFNWSLSPFLFSAMEGLDILNHCLESIMG